MIEIIDTIGTIILLAERLNLTSDECENVYYMALLHDIGKIGVPNEIINSTSKLSDE